VRSKQKRQRLDISPKNQASSKRDCYRNTGDEFSSLDLSRNCDSHYQKSRLSQQFDRLLDSLSNLVGEIAALEINTMIVEEIEEVKLTPWQLYQSIYPISPAYLEQSKIHPSLRDRYLQIRRQLEIEYLLLAIDPLSGLYQPAIISQIKRDLSILSQPISDWEKIIATKLPQPIPTEDVSAIPTVHLLLHNYHFLQSLRKLGNVKIALDRRNYHLLELESNTKVTSELKLSTTTDLIYAQTLIQLDGKIVNRYAQEILTHPQKDSLLSIHGDSVQAGEKQWRELLEFVINLFQYKK
jgi:hypothetical protein